VVQERRHIVSNTLMCVVKEVHKAATEISEVSTEELIRMHVSVRHNPSAKVSLPLCRIAVIIRVEDMYIFTQNLGETLTL
jgi:hypothetical protein